MKKIPIQYFNIDKLNKKFDYAYPLVKKAIKELIDTNKIDNLFSHRNYLSERYFKIEIIDTIKTTNIFGKYYIDNYYEIPTIFRKYIFF